jgi:hypothetical protein
MRGTEPFLFHVRHGQDYVLSAHTHDTYQLKYAGDPHPLKQNKRKKTKGNKKKSHSNLMKSREVSRQAQIDSLI